MSTPNRRWQYLFVALNAFWAFTAYLHGPWWLALLCTLGLFSGVTALVYGRPTTSRRVVSPHTTPTPRERP